MSAWSLRPWGGGAFRFCPKKSPLFFCQQDTGWGSSFPHAACKSCFSWDLILRQGSTEVDQFVFSFGLVQFLDDRVHDVRVVVDREDVTKICLVAAFGTPSTGHVRLEGVRTVGNLAGRIQFHFLAFAKGVLPLVRNAFFYLLRMIERETLALLVTMTFESLVHKNETTYNYFSISSHHKRAQGRPATTMLSPVIQLASEDRRNLTTPEISSGTPRRLTPIPSSAFFQSALQRALLNLVLIRPGQTQLTLISSSSSSLAKILVIATSIVLVMAQCPITAGRSYPAQLAKMTIDPFCCLRWGMASWMRKKVLLQLMSNIFWISLSLASRKAPIWVETAALGTRQSI